jgi:hypothetical protein
MRRIEKQEGGRHYTGFSKESVADAEGFID